MTLYTTEAIKRIACFNDTDLMTIKTESDLIHALADFLISDPEESDDEMWCVELFTGDCICYTVQGENKEITDLWFE